MCSPKVAQVVSERIKKEGRPVVNRRNFLKLGGLAAGVALAPGLLPSQRARAHEVMEQVVDLSHVFTVNSPTYDPTAIPWRQDFVTIADNGFYIQQWNFYEHTGTHVDAPAHFIEDADTIDNYAAEFLISPAIVIDIAARAESDPDTELTVEDIQNWESANGEIPAGALVCMYSGWDSRFQDVIAFRNAGEDGIMHFPGFSGEAAAFLVAERDIHGIAVDTLSLDNGISTTFDTHYTILGAGKYGVEGVANLAQIKDKSAMVIVGVPRWEAGSGGPARVLAMVTA